MHRASPADLCSVSQELLMFLTDDFWYRRKMRAHPGIDEPYPMTLFNMHLSLGLTPVLLYFLFLVHADACASRVLCRVLTELVSKMRDMQMDKTELGCLRAIVLFNPGTHSHLLFWLMLCPLGSFYYP